MDQLKWLGGVCVCVIFYLISRYMQPDKAVIAAPPMAVSPFSSAFFPNETSWSTGRWLGGMFHSDPKWSVLMFGLDENVAYVVAIAEGSASGPS